MKLTDIGLTQELLESLEEAGLRRSAQPGHKRPSSMFKTPPGAMIPAEGVMFLYDENHHWLMLTHDQAPERVGASVAIQLHKIWANEYAAESLQLGEAGPRTGNTSAAALARTLQRKAQQPAPQPQAQPQQPTPQPQAQPQVQPQKRLRTGGKVAGQLSQTPNAIKKRKDRAAAKTQQEPEVPAGPPRLPTGQRGTLYGINYVYDSEQNRWIDQRNNLPARGLAHRKLMKSFRADDYGVLKGPSMGSRLSNRLGGPFGQGIDPEAGIAQRAMGTLGSMIGRGLSAAIRPAAKAEPVKQQAPAKTKPDSRARKK